MARRRVVCHYCNSSGIQDCPWCHDTGVDSEGNVCSFCEGTGAVLCGKCDGVGYLEVDDEDK